MGPRTLLCITCCLVIAVAILGCSSIGSRFDRLDVSDVAGNWRAEYDEAYFRARCGYTVAGVETLTLKANGTYQQVYSDGRGYVYESPWNKWYLDEYRGSSVVRLAGARFYPLGIEDAEKMATGELVYHAIDYGGERIDLDGSELPVYVYVSPAALGGLHLRHLQACDPDAPAIVDFYLESAPAK